MIQDLKEIEELLNDIDGKHIGFFDIKDELKDLVKRVQTQALSIANVSGSAFLYDELSKKPVKMWYVDEEGNYYIDTDPNGVDMSGKRRILPVNKDRYKVHYR